MRLTDPWLDYGEVRALAAPLILTAGGKILETGLVACY
jgi:hypothetical protein